MKNYYYLIFLLLLAACAPIKEVAKQNYPSPFEFQTVDTVNLTKEQIYIRANEWLANTFNSSKAVIQMQDKEAGKIIGKGAIGTPDWVDEYGRKPSNETVYFLISFDIKDSRYRCILSQFVHEGEVLSTSYGLTHSTSLGNLDSMSTHTKGSSYYARYNKNRYYDVKNSAMSDANRLLKSLKDKMHEKSKDF